MSTKAGRLESFNLYLDDEMHEKLKALKKETGIGMNAYIRRAIETALKKGKVKYDNKN